MPDTAAKDARLRRLRARDLAAAHALSIDVGWPHRLEDWDFVHRLGRGFALTDAADALIGTALCWPFGLRFATLGMVIVSGRWQRRGLGERLLNAVLDEIGSRTTVLNGTPDGLRLYERAGFRALGIVRQYRGSVVPAGASSEARGRIRPSEPRELEALIALDEHATGMPRGDALTALFEHARAAVLERDGEIAGFAGFRRFGRGHVVGPVVAADAEDAHALVRHWLQASIGLFVRIDVPTVEPASWAWLTEAGLAPAGEVTTMFRGTVPARSSSARTFALINQAMG